MCDDSKGTIYLKVAVWAAAVANTSVILFHFLMDFLEDNPNPDSTNVYIQKYVYYKNHKSYYQT